ncbi:L-lactate dehydrogenase 2 protein [Salinisphaera shabanensis E1L3A]|uniref:L-lactate dehydrogenase n=1 Tax=Salinisphaera shabanensis E1L3A TaxID=1033802 RepID=U2FTZ3_9GAMM|nr:L-lactate dehydrogenase [Salinisphaera shabanensis]ERJ19434.1 L-lactate dehydrogenase 2 protein [Salinisphaera shabanensis E1L3A]
MKIAVIGAGNVGVSICDYILLMGSCSELVLVDIDRERAQGEIMDFSHTTALTFARNTRLVSGDYSDCRDADIVIITAGAQIKRDQTRDELASINAEITIDIAREVERYAPDALLILVTNPVDITAYFVIANTGYPRHRVISSGCIIDTARFMKIVGDHLGIDPKNVFGYVLGEHGKTAFIAWSLSNIAGVPLDAYCARHDLPILDRDRVLEDVKQVGLEIFRRKGNTDHGIAASVFRIVQAVSVNEHSILPVGVMLQGEYGLDDVVLSVPAVIDRTGVARVIDCPLEDEERKRLHDSAAFLRGVIDTVRHESKN